MVPILTLKPGLKPKPSPSPARAVNQGPAPSFHEPEPYQAEPKPGHLSRARPCTSLTISSPLRLWTKKWAVETFENCILDDLGLACTMVCLFLNGLLHLAVEELHVLDSEALRFTVFCTAATLHALQMTSRGFFLSSKSARADSAGVTRHVHMGNLK